MFTEFLGVMFLILSAGGSALVLINCALFLLIMFFSLLSILYSLSPGVFVCTIVPGAHRLSCVMYLFCPLCLIFYD